MSTTVATAMATGGAPDVTLSLSAGRSGSRVCRGVQPRDFTKRLGQMPNNARPTMAHAGCYAAVLHYLKAVDAMGFAAAKASGAAAVEKMKSMPTSDDCFGEGTIRPDGRKIHPAYLFQVKKPAESKGPWDYYTLINTIPADQAFRPLAEGGCPLVRT